MAAQLPPFRSLTTSARVALTGPAGAWIYDTDNGGIYRLDGSTAGGVAPILGASANPFPVHGDGWFDVRNYEMSTSATDNGPALQAAHDAAAAWVASVVAAHPGRNPQATVFIPGNAASYQFKTPVFVDAFSGIRFLGEGSRDVQSTSLAMATGYAYPLFVTGVSRTNGTAMGASYRPDLFNKLDNSACTGTGQRFGLRTNGDAFVWSDGSSLSHGANSVVYNGQPTYYYEDSYLTIEFFIEGFSSGYVPPGGLFGIGTAQYPATWFVSSNGSGSYTLSIVCQTAKFGPGTSYSYTFSTGATGATRISIQVDFVNRKVLAFANGIQVAVSGSPMAAGSAFYEVEDQMWSLNAEAATSANVDYAIYGLCLSNSPRYADRGTGQSQVANPATTNDGSTIYMTGAPTGGTWTYTYKGQTTSPLAWNINPSALQTALQGLSTIGSGNVTVSGTAGRMYMIAAANGFTFASGYGSTNGASLTGTSLTDLWRYFPYGNQYGGYGNADPCAFAFFNFTESPTNAPRHLSVAGPAAIRSQQTSAFLLNDGALANIASSVEFESIGISCGPGYGAGVYTAHALEHRFKDVGIGGGLWAVNNLPYGANYVLWFDRCYLSGNDASIKAYNSGIKMRDITFSNNGRSTLRLRGCNFAIERGIVSASGHPQHAFCSIYDAPYGGIYRFNDISIDNEDATFERSLFYAQRHSYTYVALDVDTFYASLLGPVPAFILDDMSSSSVYGSADLTVNRLIFDITTSLATVNGPGWGVSGSVGLDGASAVVNLGTYPGNPRSDVVGGGYLPPKFGVVTPGTLTWNNPAMTDGQFRKFLSAASGRWGTTTSPSWVGRDSLPADSTASLAAYALDHTAISCTLSGQSSSYGVLTDYAANLMTSALFGSMPTIPSTYYVGLATGIARRDSATLYEVSGNGYQRVAVNNNGTAFPAASGNSKSSGSAITFPTATGSYEVAVVFISDSQNGGNILAEIQLAEPIAFSASQTPSIALGGMTFTHAPIRGNSVGGMTDAGWRKVYDWMFGKSTLTVPSTWYVAMTSSASTSSAIGAELSGGGYARASLANGSSHWSTYPYVLSQHGDVSNLQSIAFASPSGSQGTAVGCALYDAITSGAAWWYMPLASAVTPASAAPTFAVGSLYLGI